MSALAELQDELISQVETCIHDPLGFAKFAFPWSESELEEPGPRNWQAGILEAIGHHLRDRRTRFTPCLIAVSSGHGIGKTALISQIINWAMSTCEDCKIVLTANTEPQLRTKTWPEVSKWFRLAINAHWWKVADTSIAIRDAAHAGTWRTDRVTWTEHNTEAFAGLHNKGKRIVLIFDEASAIADKVWEVAEGALTDEFTEIIWLAFGNPTRSSGRFRECFGRFKHRWKTYQIDSRTVEGTDKQQLSKWVEDYGEDSDFVRVRVRGEFPRVGANQFISSDAVSFCRKYKAESYEGLPRVLGVDVARFGDDQTVIVLRQGRKAQTLGKYRGLDTAQVTAQVIDYIEKQSPDAVVVDSDGIGAPVYDQLKFRGFSKRLFEFHGGKPADDRAAYFNQRAEIWGRMRDWLIAGAEIPDDPEIETDLTGPLYGFSAQQQLQLEKKEDMKKRGLSSPDVGDALAMTFAVKVRSQPNPKPELFHYDPRGGSAGQGWMG